MSPKMRRALLSICFVISAVIITVTHVECQSVTRWDIGYPGAPAVSTSSGSGAPYYSLPNPGFALCAYPANAVPCTNYATTYTSMTGLTSCATNQQIVDRKSTRL